MPVPPVSLREYEMSLPAVITLTEANQLAVQLWPGKGAPLKQWVIYHRLRAILYTHAAQQDMDHSREARHLAAVEEEAAQQLEIQIGRGERFTDPKTGYPRPHSK